MQPISRAATKLAGKTFGQVFQSPAGSPFRFTSSTFSPLTARFGTSGFSNYANSARMVKQTPGTSVFANHAQSPLSNFRQSSLLNSGFGARLHTYSRLNNPSIFDGHSSSRGESASHGIGKSFFGTLLALPTYEYLKNFVVGKPEEAKEPTSSTRNSEKVGSNSDTSAPAPEDIADVPSSSGSSSKPGDDSGVPSAIPIDDSAEASSSSASNRNIPDSQDKHDADHQGKSSSSTAAPDVSAGIPAPEAVPSNPNSAPEPANGFTSSISAAASGLASGASSVASGLASGASSVASGLASGASSVASGLSSGASAAANTVNQGLSSLGSRLSSGASSMAQGMQQAGQQFASGAGRAASSVAAGSVLAGNQIRHHANAAYENTLHLSNMAASGASQAAQSSRQVFARKFESNAAPVAQGWVAYMPGINFPGPHVDPRLMARMNLANIPGDARTQANAEPLKKSTADERAQQRESVKSPSSRISRTPSEAEERRREAISREIQRRLNEVLRSRTSSGSPERSARRTNRRDSGYAGSSDRTDSIYHRYQRLQKDAAEIESKIDGSETASQRSSIVEKFKSFIQKLKDFFKALFQKKKAPATINSSGSVPDDKVERWLENLPSERRQSRNRDSFISTASSRSSMMKSEFDVELGKLEAQLAHMLKKLEDTVKRSATLKEEEQVEQLQKALNLVRQIQLQTEKHIKAINN